MTWTFVRWLGVGLMVVLPVALASGAIISNEASPLVSIVTAHSDTKPSLDRVEWDKVAGLLRQESVRKEVGLNDEDYNALVDYRKDRFLALKKQLEADLDVGGGVAKAASNGQQGAAEAEVIAQFQAAVRGLEVEFTKKANEVLKPTGSRRLKQVILQSAGPRALLDRVTIRELQLTAEQEDKIAAVIGPPKFSLQVIPNVRLEKLAKEQDTVMETALIILTAEQRKKWEALVGKPLPTADLLKGSPTSEDSMSDWTGN